MKKDLPIISIKTKYINEIKNNTKLWEFRKHKIKNYNKILVYEPNPIKKITLELLISNYYEDTPINIWNMCKEYAGITEKEFFDYFKNKKIAYAYKIKEYHIKDELLNKYYSKNPQSIMYYNK